MLVVVVAMAVVAAVAAADTQTTLTPMSHYNINYLPRQAQPQPSTASINWKPSPIPGATTPPSPPPSPPSSKTNTSPPLPTPQSPPPMTRIQISALPPSTSLPPKIPFKFHKRPKRHVPGIFLSPYFVAPVSVVLGVGQGVLFGLWVAGRGRKGNWGRTGTEGEVELEPGPPYVSRVIPNENETGGGAQSGDGASRSRRKLVVVNGSPSKYSVHGSRYNSNPKSKSGEGSLWLDRALSMRSGGGTFLWPATAPQTQNLTRNLKPNEDDPFLVPPSRATTTRTTRTAATTVSFRSAPGGEGENPDVLRHTSIRKGILERLGVGSFTRRGGQGGDRGHGEYEYQGAEAGNGMGMASSNVSSLSSSVTSRRRDAQRHGRGRGESGGKSEWVERPERTYAALSSPKKERERCLVRGGGSMDETEWVPESGFRLVQEDPDSAPKPFRRMEAGKEGGADSAMRDSVSGWLIGMDFSDSNSHSHSGPAQSDVDKCVIRPVLKTPTKTTTRTHTPSRGSSNSKNKSKPHFDSSILPAQLISSIDTQRSSYLPAVSRNISAPHKGDKTLEPTPLPATKRKQNKVHSPTPRPIPFASSPSTSPYRNLLGNGGQAAYDGLSVPSVQVSSATLADGVDSLAPPRKKRTRGAQSTRHGDTLNKVDQIMMKIWDGGGMGMGAEEDAVFRGS